MTKAEFIVSLSKALMCLPDSTRERVLEYFGEMIDDRIESGMTEEEAVAALGSMEEILKEIAPETFSDSSFSPIDEKNTENSENCTILYNPVSTLLVNNSCADLKIRSEKLPDGVTARVDYNLSQGAECVCSLENGRLKVQYNKTDRTVFSLRRAFQNIHESITITLDNPALVRGKIAANSGNISLKELVFTNSLDVGTSSGDLDALDVAVQSICKLNTASGDITGNNLTCGDLFESNSASGDAEINGIRAGKISVNAASGDLKFSKVESDEMRCNSASGDIRIQQCTSGTLHANTASGDINVSEADCADLIDLHSASGDISLRKSSCTDRIQITSINGDIQGSLYPAGEYTYTAASRLGNVKVPGTDGARPVHLKTTGGDIFFKE